MEDIELLNEIAKRNQNAFQTILTKYNRYVAAVVSRVGGNSLTPQDIEEICSDIFVMIWEKSNMIQLKNSSLKSYIGMMARNHTLNVLRTKNRIKEDGFEDDTVISLSAEESYIAENEAELLNQIIDDLEKTDRELFIRRYFYQQKIGDIAKDKHMNVKTVSSKLIKIRQKLKQTILEGRF